MVSYCTKFKALSDLIERNKNDIDEHDYIAMKKIIAMFDPSKNPEDEWKASYIREIDEEGYVPFNADRRLGQNQYASRYLTGVPGYEDLRHDHDGNMLRFKNLDGFSYHDIKIHINDLDWLHYNFQRLNEGFEFNKFKDD